MDRCVEFYVLITLSILINLPVGIIAYRKNSLRYPDGVVAAAITGVMVFLAHPILWGLLFSFFVSSSFLSKYKENTVEKINAMSYAEKGGQRDSLQVLANGGTATIGSIFVIYSLGLAETDFFSPIFLLVAISFASSTADTWATEIGTTSKSDPRWIFDLKKTVPKGTSGAVTSIGTLASVLGGIFIACTYGIFVLIASQEISSKLWLVMLLISIGGAFGSFIDTLLGASYQSVYQCPECNKLTEKRKHNHSQKIKTNHVSGYKWLNNDMVNFLSGLVSSLLLTIIYSLLV